MDSESNWAGGLFESRQGFNLVRWEGPEPVHICPGLGQTLHQEFASVHCEDWGEGSQSSNRM